MSSTSSSYSTYFKEWIIENFLPCGIVYTSEKARKIIEKNHLTPAEFLRPMADFTGERLDYNISDNLSEPNRTLLNFRFDFYDNNKFFETKEKHSDYILTMFNENAPDWNLSLPLVSKKNGESFLSKLHYYSTPWFREFEKTLLEFHHFNEYELYQQPLLSVFMCSIDENPSIFAQNLSQGNNVPKLLYEAKYQSPSEFLLIIINDCSGARISEEEKKKFMQGFIGSYNKNKYYYLLFWDVNTRDVNSTNLSSINVKNNNNNWSNC